MRLRELTVLGMVLAACPLAAGEVELAGYVGLSWPTFSETFPFDVGSPPTIAGVSINPRGGFGLDATGGIAVAGGVTWFPAGAIGIEARIDSADMDLETHYATYSVGASLPPPINEISGEVELPPARVDLRRPQPVSLNVRLRVPGSVSLNVSGGVSYLPSLEITIHQSVAARGSLFDVIGGGIDIGEVPVLGSADPTSEGSRWGGNLGAGLQLALGEKVALAVEARGFYFPTHRLTWSRADERPLNVAEEALLDLALSSLPTIEFQPIFFNATAGLALRF
jgi:hypothetical protein